MNIKIALLVLGMLVQSALAGEPPTLPPQTRLLIGIDCKRLAESPLVRKDPAPWRAVANAAWNGIEFLGVDSSKIEYIWIACGEDYPTGTLIFVNGDFDTTKLETRWQSLARSRQFSASLQKINERNRFSFELPAGSIAIPGLSTGLSVAISGPKSIVLGFDKDSVTTQFSPQLTPEARAALIEPFAQDPSIGVTLLPPVLLTGPQGLLPGARKICANLRLNDNLELTMELVAETPETSRILGESIRATIEQIRRVFPPLAKQQGIEPRMTKLLTTMAEAAKVQTEEQRVLVRIELPGDEVRKALAKP